MKYLEGGSTKAAEQGGLKAEATEAVTRRRRDKRFADLRPPMRVSDNNAEGRASNNDDLDWADLR